MNKVVNSVGRVFIITPDSDTLDRDLKVRFPKIEIVDEKEVMGFGPRELRKLLPVNKHNRAGWIYQQLLKLSGRVGKTENVLFIDADHILIQPHVFVDQEKRTVFYRSEEAYYPYYENIYRLTGNFPFSRFSYVAHKMLFNRNVLRQIREDLGGEEIGEAGFARWIETICRSLDWNLTDMPFSEFELYGNRFPRVRKKFLLWREKTLSGDESPVDYAGLVKRFGNKYLSVTYPSYLKKSDKGDMPS